MACVNTDLVRFLERREIGIIIIDSIADSFRNDDENYCRRADNLRNLAENLSELASKYNCAVVILNQVCAVFNKKKSGGETLVAALGPTWSSLVDVRLQTVKTNQTLRLQSGLMIRERELQVVHGGYLPQKNAKFVVTEQGINDLPK